MEESTEIVETISENVAEVTKTGISKKDLGIGALIGAAIVGGAVFVKKKIGDWKEKKYVRDQLVEDDLDDFDVDEDIIDVPEEKK